MIKPTIINSVGSSVVWTMTVTNGPTANSNVEVALDYPVEFTITDSVVPSGTLDIPTDTWTIGSMTKNETVKLILVLDLTGTPASFDETYTFEATVSGLDTIATNNVLTDTLQYKLDTDTPVAAGVDDAFGTLEVDVSKSDTKCSQGTTEWRLEALSVTNGTNVTWDTATGKGIFTVNDPTQALTFQYDLFCVQGMDEYEIEGEVNVTIHPQIADVTPFDHTIVKKLGGDLTVDEVATLQAQYATLTIADYDWHVLLNAAGTVTSGFPILREIIGIVCASDDRLVFSWNAGNTLEFTYADGTAFTGDTATLKTCGC